MEVVEACLYTRDAATKKHKRWTDGLLVRTGASLALFDASWTTKICAVNDAVATAGTFAIDGVLVQVAEPEAHQTAHPRPALFVRPRPIAPDCQGPPEPEASSLEELCCYSLDRPSKLRKTWFDGVVRHERRSVEVIDAKSRQSVATSGSDDAYRRAHAKGPGATFLVEHVTVRIPDDDEEVVQRPPPRSPKDAFDVPVRKPRFSDLVARLERLRELPSRLALPRLAVLSTANRTPEEFGPNGYTNLWEAAAVTRFVARLLALQVDSVLVISTYAAQRTVVAKMLSTGGAEPPVPIVWDDENPPSSSTLMEETDAKPRDVVVYMTTRTDALDTNLVRERARFRAALQRVASHIVITGPPHLFAADPFWSAALDSAHVATDVDDLFSLSRQ